MPSFTPDQEAALVKQYEMRQAKKDANTLDRAAVQQRADTYRDEDLDDEDREDFDDDTDDTDEDGYEDERDQRIAQLERELAEKNHLVDSVQGRLTPIQQNYEHTRQLMDNQRLTYEQRLREQQEQLEQLRASLEEKEADIDVSEILSEDEMDLMDPDQLNAIKKIASAVSRRTSVSTDKLKSFIATEAEQREMQRQVREVENYREKLLNDKDRNISALPSLAYDPKFQAWQEKPENADFRPLATSFLSAKTRDEAELYAKAVETRIAQYQGGKKKAAKSTDARTSLDTAADRRPKKANLKDRQATLTEIKRLSRSGSRADREKAKELLNSM